MCGRCPICVWKEKLFLSLHRKLWCLEMTQNFLKHWLNNKLMCKHHLLSSWIVLTNDWTIQVYGYYLFNKTVYIDRAVIYIFIYNNTYYFLCPRALPPKVSTTYWHYGLYQAFKKTRTWVFGWHQGINYSMPISRPIVHLSRSLIRDFQCPNPTPSRQRKHF